MLRRPPRSTLFPYPPLSRSGPARRQLLQRGLEALTSAPLQQTVGSDAHGAVRAHPACIGPGVALAQPLVVLSGGQDPELLAVGERQDGELFTFEELLHHHFAAPVAERSPPAHGPRPAGPPR